MCGGLPSRSPPGVCSSSSICEGAALGRSFHDSSKLCYVRVTLLRGLNFAMTRQGLCRTCNACITSMEGFRVLTAWWGADDGVAGPTTGTDKGNSTVTPRYAIPAASGSRDGARHFHLCGCWHSC